MVRSAAPFPPVEEVEGIPSDPILVVLWDVRLGFGTTVTIPRSIGLCLREGSVALVSIGNMSSYTRLLL